MSLIYCDSPKGLMRTLDKTCAEEQYDTIQELKTELAKAQAENKELRAKNAELQDEKLRLWAEI